MNNYLIWWNSLPLRRKKYLAEYHHWTTPESITHYQIQDIYNKEDY